MSHSDEQIRRWLLSLGSENEVPGPRGQNKWFGKKKAIEFLELAREVGREKYERKQRQLRGLSAALEIAQRDVQDAKKKHKPKDDVTGYTNVYGDKAHALSW